MSTPVHVHDRRQSSTTAIPGAPVRVHDRQSGAAGNPADAVAAAHRAVQVIERGAATRHNYRHASDARAIAADDAATL